MGLKTESYISLPQSITMTISLRTPMTVNNFNRYLIFRNFENEEIKLKITLNTGQSRYQVVITDFPETTHNLQVLGSMNHRSYWDKIYLANTGQTKELDIGRISLTVHYVTGIEGTIQDIPLLDNVQINQVLGTGDEIFLTPFIEDSVLDWAGISTSDHPIVVLAGKDLGKSGTSSEGYDQYGNNPKYRGWVSYECSEFVSWYIHEAFAAQANYDGFTRNAFRDITATGQIHEEFKDRNRSYYYNSGKRKFISEWNPNLEYTPKAGDVLIRRGGGNYEHSMIMVNWDNTDLKATVIDGPYIITLRDIEVQELERREDNPKDFIICSV